MKKGKRLLAILLACAVMVGMIPMNVWAAGESSVVRVQDGENGLEYYRPVDGDMEIIILNKELEEHKHFEDDKRETDDIYFFVPWNIRPYDSGYNLTALPIEGNSILWVQEGYTEVPTKDIQVENTGEKTMKIDGKKVKPGEYLDVSVKLPVGLSAGSYTVPVVIEGHSTVRNKLVCEIRGTVQLRVYKSHTITFDPGDGNWENSSINGSVTFKTNAIGCIDYNSIPKIKRDDKEFGGWYYEKNGRYIFLKDNTYFTGDTVLKPAWDNIQRITIDSSNLKNLTVGSKVPLKLSNTGSGGGEVIWESDNPNVASVNGTDLTVHTLGKAVIWVEKKESLGYTGARDELVIEIKRIPQKIMIDASNFIHSYTPGGVNNFELKLREDGQGEGEGEVTWESSNSNIIIEKQGDKYMARVTGKGFVTITAKKAADNVYEECSTNVMMWIGGETEAYIYPAGNGKTYVDGVEIDSVNGIDGQPTQSVSCYEWDVIEGIQAVPDKGYHFQKWQLRDQYDVGGGNIAGAGSFKYDDVGLGRETNKPLVDFVMGAYESYQVPHIVAYFEKANTADCKDHVSLVESTSENCGKAGTKAYYQCECGAAYEDSDCKTAIENLETWKAENGGGYIPPKGNHAYGAYIDIGNGFIEHTCSVCGNKETGYNPPGAVSVKVTKIEMKSNPTKTTYDIGDSLDLSGAKITLNLSNSSSEERDITSGMVSGFSSATVGEKTVTVTFMEQTTTFKVTVKEKHQHSYDSNWTTNAAFHWHECTDANCPDKVNNKKGLAAHDWGVWVTTKEPTETEKGTQERECSVCKNKETEEIESIPRTVKKIEMKSNPTKTAYNIGDPLDLTGAKITLNLSNSSSEERDITSDMVSGFDSTTAGKKTVTVTYRGQTTTFQVTVKEKHQHSYDSNWITNAAFHWHECTDANCPDKVNNKKDIAAHDWGVWVTTKEPTETEKGTQERECSVCKNKQTEDIPVKEPEHQHSFSTTWSTDETNHWHACTAPGHTDDCLADTGAAKAEHGSWNEGKCGTCGYACTHNGATTGICSTCNKDLGGSEGSGTGNGTGTGDSTNGGTGTGSGTGGGGSEAPQAQEGAGSSVINTAMLSGDINKIRSNFVAAAQIEAKVFLSASDFEGNNVDSTVNNLIEAKQTIEAKSDFDRISTKLFGYTVTKKSILSFLQRISLVLYL